jgi:two-component system OmpR family response regulator
MGVPESEVLIGREVPVYSRNVAPSKILVVDDDPDIRRIAALALERIGGFRVLLAEDAATALDLAAREAPDLVLLDVSMPGADGPSVLASLRALPAVLAGDARPVPVVFFTAASNDAEVERLRALGAVGVVPKPFEVAELPRRVRAILAELGIS